MAILNVVGFETGNSIECSATFGTFDAGYTTVKRTGSYALRCNPTTTAVGAVSLNQMAATGLHTALTAATFFTSFYFRYATKPAANSEEIASFATGTLNNLRIGSDGILSLYAATTLNATGTYALSQDTWYRIDVSFNDTTNVQEIKVYTDEATPTLLDTIAGNIATAAVVAALSLGKRTDRNGNTVDFFYDDVAISNSAYPGAGEIKMAVPIGAGAASGWTNGTGTTFAEADDVPHDTDTTYIQASATQDNQDHTFDMQSAATIGIQGAIQAVKTIVIARTGSTTGTSAVAHRRLFNGSGFELTPLELTTTYAMLGKIDETDPSAGGGAITYADFDTIEVGAAANTIAQVQRFTAAYLMSWSAGASAANPKSPMVVRQAVNRLAVR